MTLIDSLNRRYATKKFDPTQILSDTEISTLLESFRLSPSSFGLQPRKCLVITDKEIRKSLLPHSWNQEQVVDASHLLVLCAKKDLGPDDIEHFVSSIASQRATDVGSLEGYKKMMLGHNQGLTDEQKKQRAQKQVYIAQGFVLFAAATMEIDACPMEGFSPAEYDRILGLEGSGYTATIVIPVGKRDASDPYATIAKVRYPEKEVIQRM